MSSIVECKFCRNKMPEASLHNHMKRKHSLKCLYCDCNVIASLMEEHTLQAHEEINQELQKIKQESFENGKREGKHECLQELYVNCAVCKIKMLKLRLDEHVEKVHPPPRPVVIPFVQDSAVDLSIDLILRRNVINLYHHERSADVFFVFENQHRVPAHKCILASDSVVFHRMFYGELKETGDVKITDSSLNGFLMFLASFYKSRMAITEENVIEVMYLGDKYDAKKCTKACQAFLTLTLCTENVVTVLELSLMYNSEQLRQLCVKKIMEAGCAIIQMDSFYRVNRDVLREVLSTDFQGRDELTMFKACMKWAKQSCEKDNIDASEMAQLRLQLGDCFDLIRFDSMTPLQFVHCQSDFVDIFAKDELKKILKAIAKQSVDRSNTPHYCFMPAVVYHAPVKSNFLQTLLQNSFAEIESLFKNEDTADVFFVFEIGSEDPKRIPAHKCILANYSKKFDEMFYDPEKDNRDIHVRQGCADEFSVFLQSFYGKDMPLTIDNVAQVMHFANEYDAKICLYECEKFLLSNLSDDNILLAFELSYSYRRAKLYESCVRIIEKKYQSLLKTKDFLSCSHDTVKRIVMIDFEDPNTFTIFEACMKWAKFACETSNMNPSTENIVEKLGDIFGLIRFTSMTSAEFIKCQIDYGTMFNTDRLKDILKGIGDSK